MTAFNHCQYAHCESGVLSTLLTHHELTISEPMVFGLTASLSFVYLPIVKINNLALVSYRDVPKNMVKKLPTVLGFTMQQKTYSDPIAANADLQHFIDRGQVVGLQTSVFYLPYFPKDMRFHFNAHNLMVYGKKGSDYIISDPVFETEQYCDEKALTKARFAKGVFAPKGFLYYPENVPDSIDLQTLISQAVRRNAKKMLTPFPYAGIKGMRKLAKKITTLDKHNPRQTINFLTHVVRMQEEIGTGGGGFRYLYAAFLDEAKQHHQDTDRLETASQLLIQSGDTLRQLALLCVKQCKHIEQLDSRQLANLLLQVADIEAQAFSLLKGIR